MLRNSGYKNKRKARHVIAPRGDLSVSNTRVRLFPVQAVGQTHVDAHLEECAVGGGRSSRAGKLWVNQ